MRKMKLNDHTRGGLNANNLLLLGLDVVEDHVEGRALLSEVSDDGDGAADGLADVALGIELGEANPLTDLSAGIGKDQVDTGLGAKGLDQLLVLLVVAILGKDAKASISAVKGLHGLVKTTAKTVEDKRLLEDQLEGVNDAHLRGGRLDNLLNNLHLFILVSHLDIRFLTWVKFSYVFVKTMELAQTAPKPFAAGRADSQTIRVYVHCTYSSVGLICFVSQKSQLTNRFVSPVLALWKLGWLKRIFSALAAQPIIRPSIQASVQFAISH